MSIFEVADKRLSIFLKTCAVLTVLSVAISYFATSSGLEALASEYHADKEAAQKKELIKTIMDCKKSYGADYSKAPDKFIEKVCSDAEIEYEAKYGGE